MKRGELFFIGINRFLILTGIAILILASFGKAYSQKPRTFRICTFNIQNFGKTKLNDSIRVNALAGIIRKYDIVAVQEISDVSGVVPVAFRNIVNQGGNKRFAVTTSNRTGEQADDRTSQEQYAFYFDSTKFNLMTVPMLYNDSVFDYFAREPFTAKSISDHWPVWAEFKLAK